MCMRAMFADCLSPSASPISSADVPHLDINLSPPAAKEMMDSMRNERNAEDVALKNLEGQGALELAASWAESGKMKRKLEVMKKYLHDAEKQFIQRVLGEDDSSVTESSQEQCVTVPKPARVDPPVTKPKPTKTVGVPPPPPRRPNYGVASWAQTAVAMARIKSSRKRKVQHKSDDETTDEDDEEERARTMHILLCGSANVPDLPDKLPFAPPDEPSSPPSPAKSTTTRPREPDSPISVKIASRAGSSAKTKAFLTPSDSSRKITKSVPLPSATSPSSDHQEKSPYDLKRKRTMKSPAPTIPQIQDGPLDKLRNITQRPSSSTQHSSASREERSGVPPQKRRNVGESDSSSGGPLLTPTSSTPGLGGKCVSRVLAQNCARQRSSQDSAPDTNAGSLSIGPRKARRVVFTIDRHAVTERLYKAIPEQAAPSFTAKYHLRLSREQSKQTLESSQSPVPQTQSLCSTLDSSTNMSVPSQLPSEDDLGAMDIDHERSRELAETFRREIASGKRPGLVVPQLDCTRSQ